MVAKTRLAPGDGQEITHTLNSASRKSTRVTETAYRHVIVPAIRGASVMDNVFGDDPDENK
jgi:hypothetical protein